MRLWQLFGLVLFIGLLAPFYGTVTGEVGPLFSDPVTQIVIYAGLAIILFVGVFVALFSGGGTSYGRR